LRRYCGSRSQTPWLAFVSFALVFGPGRLFNALFHAGPGLRTRTYCPGVVTGLVVCIPLSILLAGLAVRDGFMSGGSAS
jgi:hypothetical protein